MIQLLVQSEVAVEVPPFSVKSCWKGQNGAAHYDDRKKVFLSAKQMIMKKRLMEEVVGFFFLKNITLPLFVPEHHPVAPFF